MYRITGGSIVNVRMLLATCSLAGAEIIRSRVVRTAAFGRLGSSPKAAPRSHGPLLG